MPEKNYANFWKIFKNHAKMGPRANVRAPNSEKSSFGEFLGLDPWLVRISRKSVTPNATWVVDLVHFFVQPLLKRLRRVEMPCRHRGALRRLLKEICAVRDNHQQIPVSGAEVFAGGGRSNERCMSGRTLVNVPPLRRTLVVLRPGQKNCLLHYSQHTWRNISDDPDFVH